MTGRGDNLLSGLKARDVTTQPEGLGAGSHLFQEPCKGDLTMSQSLANIILHLVFSTKGRRQLLRDEERGQLHAYITGIVKNYDSPLIEINSVRDHIHILFAQSKNHAPAKIVEQVKAFRFAMPRIPGRAVIVPRSMGLLDDVGPMPIMSKSGPPPEVWIEIHPRIYKHGLNTATAHPYGSQNE
jgi:hypothetical protein